MTLSSQQKCLILALAVLLLLYFMSKNNENSEQSYNEHMTPETVRQEKQEQEQEQDHEISSALDELISENQTEESNNSSVSSSESENSLKKKMLSKNSSKGKSKKVSYSAERASNNGEDALDQFFSRGNNVTDVSAGENSPFKPMDDSGRGSGDAYAPYKSSGKSTKQGSKDMFNLDNFLPQQANSDWFDNVPEPISVKNRYLINISKQVGVNTIGTSHKNPSYDIRGEEYCPKFVVSPWMQSSIEPDTSLVGLCGRRD